MLRVLPYLEVLMTRGESSRRVKTKSGGGKPPDLAGGSLFEQAMLLAWKAAPACRGTHSHAWPTTQWKFQSHGAPEKSTSQTTDAHKIVSESARLFGEAPQPNRPSSMMRTLLLALLGAAAAQEVEMEVRAGVCRCP